LLYTPRGQQENNVGPSIVAVNGQGADRYFLVGTNLNGLTTGCAEGDDMGLATNFPIVFATSTITGNVYYFRSHDFDQMAPKPGHEGYFSFAVPPGSPSPPPGPYQLTVSASGARGSVDVLLGYLLSVSCPVMSQNSSASCSVGLSNPAPANGLTVALSIPSSLTTYLTVPPTVVVPTGQTQATFIVQSHSVSATRTIGMTATGGGISVRRMVTITP
jgi:hypothetical protein